MRWVVLTLIMIVRLLFVLAVAVGCVVSTLSAKPPCELSDADYAALAHPINKQPLDRATIDALSEKDAANLCKARAFVAKVRALAGPNVSNLSDDQAKQIGEKIDLHDIAPGTKRFVTEQEYDLIGPVIAYVMARASWGKIQ